MRFLTFVFSFLYVRNWYTGQRELSRPRLYLFASGVGLILLGLLAAYLLQLPVTYEAP